MSDPSQLPSEPVTLLLHKPAGFDAIEGLKPAARLAPCKVSWQNEIRLRFAIKAVRPGQLRDMCAQVGLDVVAIRRIRIGRIPLAKLPVGAWCYLPVGGKF
jgi:16S rRNA U516 pseudouridylate synthase RsuA-like enzyme